MRLLHASAHITLILGNIVVLSGQESFAVAKGFGQRQRSPRDTRVLGHYVEGLCQIALELASAQDNPTIRWG